MVSTN